MKLRFTWERSVIMMVGQSNARHGFEMAKIEHSPEIKRLFDDVFANPEDVGARLVLADALQERDDPRGELIALQYQRAALEQGPSKRERQLLRKYEVELLGRLHPAVMKNEPVLFELGFVARMAFRNNARGRECLGEPSWSTVQWLDLKDATSRDRCAALLLSEPLRKWLRTAWNVRLFDAMAVAESGHDVKWRELGVVTGMDETELAARFFEHPTTSFKDLVRVVFQPATYGSRSDSTFLARVLDSALAQTLQDLVFRADIAIWSDATCRAFAERLGAPTPRAAGPRRVAFSTRAGRITLGCHADEARSVMDVTLVVGAGEALAKQITALRHARLRRVRVSGQTHSEGDMRFIRVAVAGAGLELEVLPAAHTETT